jgi:diketogulonate reductase-like aldo/keto reductase
VCRWQEAHRAAHWAQCDVLPAALTMTYIKTSLAAHNRNSDHHPRQVEEACRRSLQDLQLSHLDLYLVHWPVTGVPEPQLAPSYGATWSAMEALVEQGLARAIGVSNLSAVKLQQLLATCRLRPAVNQVGGRQCCCKRGAAHAHM